MGIQTMNLILNIIILGLEFICAFVAIGIIVKNTNKKNKNAKVSELTSELNSTNKQISNYEKMLEKTDNELTKQLITDKIESLRLNKTKIEKEITKIDKTKTFQ